MVVGPTGAGKSTTALLLLALLRPDEGRVLLHHDGTETDLADVEPASLHRQVAWVPQRPAIVPGTVAENVAGAVTPAVERAAALAGFDAAALPAGWDTRVGHGGVGLSVGQRQRLALTRALVSDAPFVLLDEPTAHLDAATEATVIAAIRELHRQGRTVVVIAHRPAVIGVATRVVEVAAREVAVP